FVGDEEASILARTFKKLSNLSNLELRCENIFGIDIKDQGLTHLASAFEVSNLSILKLDI
ncbi:hypothetical protein ABPG73_006516, partial [Tetrahymena malaccensis]